MEHVKKKKPTGLFFPNHELQGVEIMRSEKDGGLDRKSDVDGIKY